MIGFSLRLAVAGGKEAITRLVIIGAAVALGVGLLLSILAGINAVNAQDARYAWMDTTPASATGQSTSAHADAKTPAASTWWLLREDYFDGQPIGRLDVAATGPQSPMPPGIPQLPGPGQFYASPAMNALLASTPPAQLADRFPGHQIGTIGAAGLPGPNAAIIIIGRTADQISHVPGAGQVTSIGTAVVGTRGESLDLILSVVAAGLLFPVLIFIGVATRLNATRREQRFAAMRLIGATPRQISLISAVESTAAALVGTAIGFALFFLFRHPIAGIPLTGLPFYPSDMSLDVADVGLVALGVPAGAAVAALLALRRVRISPLGVTRRVTPRPPRAYRLILLVAGIAELFYFVGRRPSTSNGQVAAFLPGMLMIMAGLVIAGPWLTMVGSRIMARRSRRPTTLIAARRLADNPQAGFRAISGLVLALFVTTVATGVITTIVAERGSPRGGLSASTLSLQVPVDGTNPISATSVPDGVTADLRSTPGVQGVTVVHRNSDTSREAMPGLVLCADLAQTQAFGRCANGAVVAQVSSDDLVGFDSSQRVPAVWPAASLTAEQLAQLPVWSLVVGTDGSTSAIEQARTVLEGTFPDSGQPPSTRDDFASDFTRSLTGWQQLANVVILTSLPIAGCSLAVSLVGGLNERKRPFSLLRLSGVPLRMLRRVVVLESAVPLLVSAVVAIGAGLLGAQLFLRAQLSYTLRPPGAEYYLIVIAGLILCLGIIASALPLLRRITGPEIARNE